MDRPPPSDLAPALAETRAAATAAEAATLLAVVRTLAAEAHPGGGRSVELDSSLERDLGLDSLSRAELLLRLERAFGVGLPERALAEAETPRDLLRGLQRITPSAPAGAGSEPLAAPPSVTPAPSSVVAAPAASSTLLAVLDWHAERHPERRHLLFLDGERGAEELTYAALHARAGAVATALLRRGLEPGAAVALMLPSGLDYFACFLGVQRAGGVPVPLYPPARRSQIEDHLRRQAGILRNARVRLLLAAPEVRALARLLVPLAPDLRAVVTPAELAAGPTRDADDGVAALPPIGGQQIAFLQYTSGSTGNPKGVVLTHANLLANLRAVGKAVHLCGDDVVVSWLPLYHDMGLIGAWMGSLYFGMPLVLMSPLSFLARPVRWLQALSSHQGTIAAAPNFAYALCVKKVAEDELAGLDLGCWRVAMNGAEPVSPAVLDAFAARFAPCGFRRQALMPVYGLAESSLALAFPPVGRGPRVDAVARQPLQRDGRALPVDDDEAGPQDEAADVLRLVSAGHAIPDHEVRIVDDAGRELPERHQGRLQFRGPSATSGYFRNAEATAQLLVAGGEEPSGGGWLDSGDLAYVADGEVFITGRRKDVVIRAGRNIHPQELEEAVGALPGVRKGCVAVFAAGGEEGTERLVVMAEVRPGGEEGDAMALRRRIGELTSDLAGAAPDDVLLVPPGSVPKTSSGKLRRAAARQLYEQGALAGSGRRHVAWQLLRLALAGAGGRATRAARRAGEIAWATWAWLLLALLAPLAWAAVLVLPGRGNRRRATRLASRLLLRGSGVPLRVAGLERLPPGPCVVASNHQSYVDGFLLSALLPPRFAFVVKNELAKSALTRLPLARLGALFVDRLDAEKGTADARRAADAVAAG
ncbi:MAG TPA: AMP-binding protein, partial [Thermoanaerobaculia bacterium]|nr:AMP-binding protein [Thermoanaerobaculia bacterium]